MQYRTLGKTGLRVSTLSFGASSLGGVFHEIDEAEAIRAVHTAIDLGINLIDVSPYYGITRAETVLGKALREIPRDRYLLATKVGRYGDAEFDFSAQRVTAGVDQSLRRLQVEHIDLIQCHDIEFGSLGQVVEETLPALRELRRSGKVRFLGITGYPLHIFRSVLDRAEVDTILSYCRYSLHDTSLAALLPYLESKLVGIISASPLSMGLLTERGAPAWHPAPMELRQACTRAAAHCRSRGVDIAELALAFALDHARIHTTLVSTANPENLRKNVSWVGRPPDPELLAEVRAILAPVESQGWPVGRPENNQPVETTA